MQELNDILILIDSYIGSSFWFPYVLIGTGLFFTFYLKFPQIRYFGFALKVVKGKFDKSFDKEKACMERMKFLSDRWRSLAYNNSDTLAKSTKKAIANNLKFALLKSIFEASQNVYKTKLGLVSQLCITN